MDICEFGIADIQNGYIKMNKISRFDYEKYISSWINNQKMMSLLSGEFYFFNLVFPDFQIEKIFFYKGYMFNLNRFNSVVLPHLKFISSLNTRNYHFYTSSEDKSEIEKYQEEYYKILENLEIFSKTYYETSANKNSKIKRYRYTSSGNKSYDFFKEYSKRLATIEPEMVFILDIINEEYK